LNAQELTKHVGELQEQNMSAKWTSVIRVIRVDRVSNSNSNSQLRNDAAEHKHLAPVVVRRRRSPVLWRLNLTQ